MDTQQSTPLATTESSNFSPEQLEATANKSRDDEFENRVVSWAKAEYVKCRTRRQVYERQWYINLSFYTGRQNVRVIPVSGGTSNGIRLYTPPAPYYRSRRIFNRIRPIVRTELARLTSQKPTATIIPATGEDTDLAAAQAGEQIWDSVYRDKQLKKTFRKCAFWSVVTGNGFMKAYWDPEKVDNAGNEGDFCFENVTPFHMFFPDLITDDIEDQPYVIHIQTKSPEWVRLHYPGINIHPNVVEASDIINDSFLRLAGASDYHRDSVLCMEVWVKPEQVEFMPEGGMFTLIGDRLVQFVQGNPYEHQKYPFVKFDAIPTGRFYADSVVDDLISVQREYNQTRNQTIESKNRMAHPQLIAPKGSIVASKITTEPGQVIEYELGLGTPEPLPLQNLPSYVLQEVDRLIQDFEDISGQHQVSKGQVPPGVTAASAITFLQEQDETMLATTFDSIEEGFEKLGHLTLCYVKQYWDTPRTIKVVGRDGQFNVIAFQGATLRDNTDIRIEAGSALPTSKSAKQALLMDLMSQGFVPPEKGLELMDVGGVKRLYEEIQIDSAQASRENMRMSIITQEHMEEYLSTFQGEDPGTGEPILVDPNTGEELVDERGVPMEPPLIVPVNSYDNHEAHITVHNNFRKSQEFENLSQEIKDLFEAHVNQHIMAMGAIPGVPENEQMGMQEEEMMEEEVPPEGIGSLPDEEMTNAADFPA
jgi:hypothetical protein